MTTSRCLRSLGLTAALIVAGCGGGEPSHPEQPAQRTPAPAGTVPVACIVRWTSGTSGALVCGASGPDEARVRVDKDTFQLDKICVNDKRIASYTTASGTMPLTTKTEGNLQCADFGGAKQLPESCSCVAPPGGDCNPSPRGFVCIAKGHVSLGG